MTSFATLQDVHIYPEHTRKALGRIARFLRQRDGHSQTVQGTLAGVSRSTIVRIESGDAVDLRSINKLEKSFRMPAEMFRRILENDRTFVAALDIDGNLRMTVLRILDDMHSVEGGSTPGDEAAEHG